MTKFNTTQASDRTGHNVIINNAQFYWAKLDKPVSPFGALIWELSVHLPKKDKQIPELEAEGLVFKEDTEKGTMYTNVKRKATKADGSENTKVVVVDSDKQPVDAKKIGNGSTGKVKLWNYSWKHSGRSGVSNVLQAVLIENLVQYRTTGALDMFEADLGDGRTTKVPASAVTDTSDDF